jgi:hypothetical protein
LCPSEMQKRVRVRVRVRVNVRIRVKVSGIITIKVNIMTGQG